MIKKTVYVGSFFFVIAVAYGINNYLKSSVTKDEVNTKPIHPVSFEDSNISQPAKQQILPIEYDSQYGGLPEALRDVPIGYQFYLDEEGNLIPTESVRDIFDHFLSAIEDEPFEIISARIVEYIDLHLTEPARTQALDVFGEYVSMKMALKDLEEEMGGRLGTGDFSNMASLVTERNALIRQSLSDDVYEAFYQQEHMHDEYTLSRMSIINDKNLSDEDKDAALQALEQTMPESMKQVRENVTRHLTMADETKKLREQGVSESDIQVWRHEQYGYEAAERLKGLDERRAQWNNRLQEYNNLKAAIASQEGIDESDKQRQINELRSSLFDEKESIRVSVIEKSTIK